MPKNITLMGASFTDVPGVLLPQTGGGTALFTDVTPTTAVETDVASGKFSIKQTALRLRVRLPVLRQSP